MIITPEMLLTAVFDADVAGIVWHGPDGGNMRSVHLEGGYDLVKAAALLNGRPERLRDLHSRGLFTAADCKRDSESRWRRNMSRWAVPTYDGWS